MAAYGTNLGSLAAYMDMSALTAYPDAIVIAAEDYTLVKVGKELAITLLVSLLDSAYKFKLACYLLKALLARCPGHADIHFGMLEMFAGGCVGKIFGSRTYAAPVKIFKPYLSVDLFVFGRFGENRTYLLITVFLCLAGEKLIFICSHRFTSKGIAEIFLCLRTFQLKSGLGKLMFLNYCPFHSFMTSGTHFGRILALIDIAA